ncbi:hypothetical protein ACFSKI_03380 [Pseudogracilibacillus auburnensis]|uniref:Uncharacterized protein n=1 Tax=Pseudogracilibacillus auburnensis TaxID=1494959 RepID=A0A2V3W162_9BACI|nr:hypothetical protein [Pseudogracilibacillus auburnensis]PXW88053.1 hypothetical protein DFR56_104204 [Pseudogracilibacillus auburnensis]
MIPCPNIVKNTAYGLMLLAQRFDRMTDDGYFFVLRLNKNAVIREEETFSLPKDSTVLDSLEASLIAFACLTVDTP